jgi:Fe-Mn family superoxide dismutase
MASFFSRLIRRAPVPTVYQTVAVPNHGVTNPLTPGAFMDPLQVSNYATDAPSTHAVSPAPVYVLPDLPYDFNSLEPVISAQIMVIHHQKHHQAYVTNLNSALEKYHAAAAKRDLQQMIHLSKSINFNGGGHVNHSIFWTNLASKGTTGGGHPGGDLNAYLVKEFGSYDKFVEKFNNETIAIQGSGWGWLGYDGKWDRLRIVTLANQDPVATLGLFPLLGVDVWEHAYYLQYKNDRAAYMKAIWQVVNWRNVEERFANARKSVTVHTAAVQAEAEAKAKAEEEKKKAEEAVAAAEKEKNKI